MKNPFAFIIICFLFQALSAQTTTTINLNGEDSPACEWGFSGHLGETIDRIAGQRILDQGNWDCIYPETEDAFRLREDDEGYPVNGRWRGEFWGKYMLSVIAACHYYHSEELKQRIRDAVEGLISTQEENGYIGTYTQSDFLIGNNWNVWCRKYTLWGLVEAYRQYFGMPVIVVGFGWEKEGTRLGPDYFPPHRGWDYYSKLLEILRKRGDHLHVYTSGFRVALEAREGTEFNGYDYFKRNWKASTATRPSGELDYERRSWAKNYLLCIGDPRNTSMLSGIHKELFSRGFSGVDLDQNLGGMLSDCYNSAHIGFAELAISVRRGKPR